MGGEKAGKGAGRAEAVGDVGGAALGRLRARLWEEGALKAPFKHGSGGRGLLARAPQLSWGRSLLLEKPFAPQGGHAAALGSASLSPEFLSVLQNKI